MKRCIATSLALFALALLVAVPRTEAFMAELHAASGEADFTFALDGSPQWTFETPDNDTYAGNVFDSARFGAGSELSFSDAAGITFNGSPVHATLKGKISAGCGSIRIKLEDATNRRSFVIEQPLTSATCTVFAD